ncbi:hypothetical protein LUZ60_004020 [Juncus effusus]|nr:hypothetical protein LUZ60_004020 [Juncus effusus]
MHGVSMGRRRKGTELNNNNTTNNTNHRTDTCSWTTAMDGALIDAFVRQESIGNRVHNGSFTSDAYANITIELREKFKDKPLDKERIKNRIKYIKKNFVHCYEVFKDGLEGFTWNPVTMLWTAEPENWEKLIEANPEAAEWMNKPVPHYEKLSLLYFQNKENNNTEQRDKRVLDNSSEDNQLEAINLTFEGLDGINNNNPLEDESCSTRKQRAKKVKVNKDYNNIMILKEGMDRIVEAINKCTVEIVKSRERLPIPEGQMWDLLVELGFEESVISTVYIFLIERPHMVAALLGCPVERRKDLLIQMAFGNSSSGYPKP